MDKNLQIKSLFERLGRSEFRSRFKLGRRELEYLRKNGMEVMAKHAQTFIKERLAPAEPANDGKQTPMRNHPVFIAQHATGTCCRSCLEKWHGIQKHTQLSDEQIEYIISVIMEWLRSKADKTG